MVIEGWTEEGEGGVELAFKSSPAKAASAERVGGLVEGGTRAVGGFVTSYLQTGHYCVISVST